MPHASGRHAMTAGAATAPTAGLAVRGVSFFRSGTSVLEDISFSLARGRLLAIVGPSGAGKSTLLALLAGFERPRSGSIEFAGKDWTNLAPADRSIGMSFDDAALHEHLTVRENLDAAALPRGEPADRRRDRVTALVHTLGLGHLVDRRPAAISAGERRRVAVGRAFLRAPQLVLLDEPFANLDRTNRFTIRQLVRELQRSTGATTIVVTHDPTDALAIADDMLVMVRGQVRAFGVASEIATQPIDLEVAQLVDDLGMHVLEVAANNTCQDAVLPSALLSHLSHARSKYSAHGAIYLGVRPWHLRVVAPSDSAVVVTTTLLALEPAGIFTDLITQRSDGRILRARVAYESAQNLPIGTRIALYFEPTDAHLFCGPWPGVRLDAPNSASV